MDLNYLNGGLLLLSLASCGLLGLALFDDLWARRASAYLLARVQGRRAYRTAYLLELRRREMELGLPSRLPERDQIEELEGMISNG